MEKVKLTKRTIESIKPPATGRLTVTDTDCPGLQLRVTPTGVKSFVLRRRIAGKPERITIGSFPTMTIEMARAEVARLNGAIAQGHDPAVARRQLKGEPTLAEALDAFLAAGKTTKDRPLSAGTLRNYKQATIYLTPMMSMRLSTITPAEFSKAHATIPSLNARNLVRTLLSRVFEFAMKSDMTLATVAPIGKTTIHEIPSRERFIGESEMPNLLAAIDQSPLRDFLLLCILTGQRRGNVQSMQWAHLDLDRGIWRIPSTETKNREPMTVALSSDVIAILVERLAAQKQAIADEQAGTVVSIKAKQMQPTWVFPGTGATGHLVEPKKAWATVLKRAGLEDVRIHDLRRTLGSWMAINNHSLPMIGAALGHKTAAATTIYARLQDSSVRNAVADVGGKILSHRKTTPAD